MTLKRIFFSKCLSDHFEQLLPIETSLKNQVKVLKKGINTKLYWKNGTMTALWRHTSETCLLQNASLVMLNNYYHHQHCLKIKLKVSKKRIKLKNYWKTSKWRLHDIICQKRDMLWKIIFFQDVSLIMLNNFYQHNMDLKSN